MKRTAKILILLLCSHSLFAGNGDRSGEAGATQLLINPYARSSALGNASTSSIEGLESQFINIAGITKTKGTELIFCRTSWLKGTDININNFGFSQKLGERNYIAFGIMSFSMGNIPITTVDLPDGGIGTYSPQFINIGTSYARQFTSSISGGVTLRVISEAIANIQGLGMGIDAGIQYITGKKKNIGFGIALKNAGPKMRYTGDGLSVKAMFSADRQQVTLESRSQAFELPLLMNIGAHYRFDIGTSHQLFAQATFVSNAFMKDQYCVGVEYRFKKYFMARTGFVYEDGIFNVATRTTALTGPTAGFSVELPYKEKMVFAFDYSYRDTSPFQGTHSFGARISF
ncbi:MAG: PorV/PorQ family protein [Bacteroidetes bacterium]|nr:PorV/PorQ family protein [Bacteroidota bacterium]